MITFMLIAILTTEPLVTFGILGTFKTMRECRDFIAKDVKEEFRARMECLPVVRGDVREA